ncbi:hypothetical protein FISHEDRAFT_64888 [Fistulina hepatica ATCC 64428]|uniref:Ubiquitin-activating enzyme E1-like n=1 Tax=Fistulina hepatica ATCC 64428 TaxID=1128425 RepID=A0A0D7AGH5_9AGAR|nr:hypothetical protein FISHEDRAFT_64888 [Fistulina hepatica ATCC 64428]
MSTAALRTTHAKAILGEELYARLADTKVLVVGSGGIGCELLKNVVLVGFGYITLLDLDTIDLSNLNRQFLFRKKDVKKSKCMVAARAAAHFNPNVKITPIHGNIKEPQFDVKWFQQFGIVLNALDNLDARRHVNKMCMAGQIPLVESGTAGYLGQVQPILKDKTECFDCVPKPTQKTFPVCTIRSTPSQPIHCIVWSKSYLMGQLFGEDEDAVGELDEAEKQGENAQEIANLRKEAQAFSAVRQALRTTNAQDSAAKMVFEKVFKTDVQNLLKMTDMWRSREPPVPLDFDAIMNGEFVFPAKQRSSGAPAVNGHSNGIKVSPSTDSLKDQRELSLKDNLSLFVSSVQRLAVRLQAGEEIISFDKDDDDTLDFVTASSNLRSYAYGITPKTRWEIKELAGNIIPAIATTNAIVAGLIVLQALNLLRGSYSSMRTTLLQFKPSVPLNAVGTCPPSPGCGICRDTYIPVACDPSRTLLGDIVKAALGEEHAGREVSVYEDKRVLSDPDWDDNNARTLQSLNITRGKFLNIVDEDEERATISLALSSLPADHQPDALPFILPDPLPKPPRKVKPPAPTPATPPRSSLKRSAPPSDDEIEPSSKRIKSSGAFSQSPSKKRRLEEDGLVLLESANETLNDDVIIID